MNKNHELLYRKTTGPFSERAELEQLTEGSLTKRRESKPETRNVNPTANLYGRRSESVTSFVERNSKRRLTFKEEARNLKTIVPSPYGISIKADIAIFHNPKISKINSKHNIKSIYASQMNKETPQKIQQITNERLREEIKIKEAEILTLRNTINTIESIIAPLNFSIGTLGSFVKEYQELQQSQISMASEIKVLKEKYYDAEQQLKFVESMEQNKRHKLKVNKNKNSSEQKSPFEKIDTLLSNLNISLYQLNDVICQPEFLESILSIKVEKEAEEIAKHKDTKGKVSHYSERRYSDNSEDESKQQIEIDEQALEFLKKSSEDQIASLKNGFNEMRDCWKLYYSFMKSFLEVYACEGLYESREF